MPVIEGGEVIQGATYVHTYDGTASYQVIAADLKPAAAAGSNDGADSSFIAAIMGNLIVDSGGLTEAANYLAGIIGHFSAIGTIATTYPAGGVLAGIGDGVNDTGVFGVCAYIDGDGSTTIAGAAFKVMSNNSTAASGFHYGLDLYSAAHDGYQAVDQDFYLTADLRLAGQNIVKSGNGTPEGVVTAPIGSIFLRLDGGATTTLYIKESGAGNTGWVAK